MIFHGYVSLRLTPAPGGIWPGSADIPELSHRMPAESGTSITLTALKGEEAESKGHGMMS